MSDELNQAKTSGTTQDCSAIETEKRLREEIEKLARQAQDVAKANAHAAELMVKLEEANENLQREIEKRKTAESHLRQIHVDTEAKVEQRTAELTREVAEREQIEEALRASEERLRNIVEHSTNIFYSHTLDDELLYVSPQATAVLGYALDEQGHKWTDFVSDNPANQKAFESTQKAIETGLRQPPYELELIAKDGHKVWLEINEAPVVRNGKTIAIVGAAQDITERRCAEQALRESKQRLDIILNAILTGVFIVDAQTHQIVDINPLAAKMVGLPKEQIIGKLCHKFVCPAEQGKCPISDLGQTVDQSERVLLTADGRKVPVLKTVISASWSGRQYFIESFVDIAELKKAQTKQADLLQQLENVNKELRDFAYIVSHDLKAPLRGIKTLASWIATDYTDKLDQQGKEQIALLLTRCDRMQNLIDGILQYSRLGHIPEEIVEVNLDELLPIIIDTVAPPQNISITIENKLPVIKCGRTRITQVFQNLISNAVKYMDKPQGSVRIGCIEDNGFWKFSVADNGPGIEEKFFERIFQMFQTLAPRDQCESTGIGLSLAKKIVEMFGGKIWVESKLGQGSTFFFTFPQCRTPVEEPKLQPAESHI